MIAYVGLFLSALVAATILPMQSEAVLVGLLIAYGRKCSGIGDQLGAGAVSGAIFGPALVSCH